jgi:hypothetical protein
VWALTAHAGAGPEVQRAVISEVLTGLFEVLAAGRDEDVGLDPFAVDLTRRALAARGLAL